MKIISYNSNDKHFVVNLACIHIVNHLVDNQERMIFKPFFFLCSRFQLLEPVPDIFFH
jgi:hypothetical protein